MNRGGGKRNDCFRMKDLLFKNLQQKWTMKFWREQSAFSEAGLKIMKCRKESSDIERLT